MPAVAVATEVKKNDRSHEFEALIDLRQSIHSLEMLLRNKSLFDQKVPAQLEELAGRAGELQLRLLARTENDFHAC